MLGINQLAIYANFLYEFGMIQERILIIWEYKGLTAKKLEEFSGIDREKWYALKQKKRRVNEDDINAIVKMFPNYALWLVSGTIGPECGQTSPDYDKANRELGSQNAG